MTMYMKLYKPILWFLLVIILLSACKQDLNEEIHIYEVKEIVLESDKNYFNPYVEVECWVELSGPDFKKKIFGFWNGGNKFVFRLVATNVGEWTWKSFSNQTDDGLNNHTGSYRAIVWSDNELEENPNRRGFIRADQKGHALMYSDGTPFVLQADTWWAAATWRYPFKGEKPAEEYTPGPGIGFEEAIQWRKKQGYNSIALIASFPNWNADDMPASLREDNPYSEYGGTPIRQAWKKSGTSTAQDMHDENGNRPFFFPGKNHDHKKYCADYDRINPEYFQSLDKKMQYMASNGFVPFFEAVRRDHGPTWKRYYDWEVSYPRYVQYLVARYGCYNMIFSGVHADWIHKDLSLQSSDWNHILSVWHEKYGPLPYGQPTTAMAFGSTLQEYGHREKAPWLNFHGVGNKSRNHSINLLIEDIFKQELPYPTLNQEPYYPGYEYRGIQKNVESEVAAINSKRDNYFARAMMYGSVLSGSLAGHVYGTGAFAGITFPEPQAGNPYIWEAMRYDSGTQCGYLSLFLLSEGNSYRKLQLAGNDIMPKKSKASGEKGLDGWAYMMRTADKSFGLIYFENACEKAKLEEYQTDKTYSLQWFNPRNGIWHKPVIVQSNSKGTILLPEFPQGGEEGERDWGLKVKIQN